MGEILNDGYRKIDIGDEMKELKNIIQHMRHYGENEVSVDISQNNHLNEESSFNPPSIENRGNSLMLYDPSLMVYDQETKQYSKNSSMIMSVTSEDS